jgi:hypothetical protein
MSESSRLSVYDNNEFAYTLDEKPFGKTWNEWTADWWKWLLSIPKEFNPGYDNESERCLIGSDPNVVFLVGTFGGDAVRNYTIPARKAVLFPIIAFTTSYAEDPKLKTSLDLVNRAKSDMDDIIKKEATIDGKILHNVDRYRIQSPLFDLTYPEDNVFEALAGPTCGISEGYWIFLKPLSPGKHTIVAAGSCSSGKTSIGVTWHLTVLNE